MNENWPFPVDARNSSGDTFLLVGLLSSADEETGARIRRPTTRKPKMSSEAASVGVNRAYGSARHSAQSTSLGSWQVWP